MVKNEAFKGMIFVDATLSDGVFCAMNKAALITHTNSSYCSPHRQCYPRFLRISLLQPSEMFRHTPQSSGFVEHPLVSIPRMKGF